MNEKELIDALKEKLKEKDQGWKFIYGRESLTPKAMMKRLDSDKKFRKAIVEMITGLSIDLILREKP